MKVYVSTSPFSATSSYPLATLKLNNLECRVNDYGRKMTEGELIKDIQDAEILIAGTEPISAAVIDSAESLKLIVRVGIGLDSVDLTHAKKRGIAVSYTPDGPSAAVADLVLSNMISLLRRVPESNIGVKQGRWTRFFGKRLAESVVGLVGVGRIGRIVFNHLVSLGVNKIILCDIDENVRNSIKTDRVIWSSIDELLAQSDVVSLHVPLTKQTTSMLSFERMASMKDDSVLINTSRGGIVNEADLYRHLSNGKFLGVGIDVFENEPYAGNLTEFDRCLLTAHMGSMSFDCRERMESEAVDEAVRFARGDRLLSSVPDFEYEISREKYYA